MALLLDQGLPPLAADLLRQRGIDATHVREHGMSAASDPVILEFAERLGAVVVTYDGDFNALLAQSGAKTPSVVRIRIEGLRAASAADLIERVVGQVGHEFASGVSVSVEVSRVRIHRLPLT
jgi:predicted nuclease of predicted toxin-antitoxin system